MVSEKTCTKCGEAKPLDDFHRDKWKVDGRSSYCKECRREYHRRYHEENRDERLEYHRRYYGENRDERLEYGRRYYEENRDGQRERKRRYYGENRDILKRGDKIRHAQRMRTSNLLASKKGVPYSQEEDALILCDNGMTDYQKAIELGRTHASVKLRKRRLRARAGAART